MAERKEAAADITVQVSTGSGDSEGDDGSVETLDVTQLSVTKDIEIDEIYGAGNTMPAGYAITQISYSGDFTVPGDKLDLDDTFFDSNGVPTTGVTITITHRDGGSTTYEDVLVTSEGYEVSDGEVTETSYEFVAMGKDSDSEPSEGSDEEETQ